VVADSGRDDLVVGFCNFIGLFLRRTNVQQQDYSAFSYLYCKANLISGLVFIV